MCMHVHKCCNQLDYPHPESELRWRFGALWRRKGTEKKTYLSYDSMSAQPQSPGGVNEVSRKPLKSSLTSLKHGVNYCWFI